MRILQVKCGQFPVVIEVEHSLDMMRKLVGGYIEMVQVSRGIDLWLNEEGKLDGLPFNFYLAHNKMLYDSIVGDAFFASHDYEGNTVSLTDAMIHEIMERFVTRHVLVVG